VSGGVDSLQKTSIARAGAYPEKHLPIDATHTNQDRAAAEKACHNMPNV
jgi:hypothetical protein